MIRPTVTVVIATRNRASTLRTTLQALGRLDPAPDELIVALNAPADTADAIVANAPLPNTKIDIVRTTAREGSVAGRDSAFAMARGDLVISLDDDSAPLQTDFLARLGALAQAHPEAGTFTFREVHTVTGRIDGTHEESGPRGGGPRGPAKPCYVGAYADAAVAIRRTVYGEAAYPRFFTHTYAEPDFCLQAYAAGYAVLHAPDIVVHRRMEGRTRDPRARHRFFARNALWSVLMRCPFPHILWVAPSHILRQATFAARRGWVLDEPRWWWQALRGLRHPLRARRPVPWTTYAAWMRLARQPLATRRDLVRTFPAVARRAGMRPVPFALSGARKA